MTWVCQGEPLGSSGLRGFSVGGYEQMLMHVHPQSIETREVTVYPRSMMQYALQNQGHARGSEFGAHAH